MSWSPNSPDLAPLDFCVWGVMKVGIKIEMILVIFELLQQHVFSHPMPMTRQELVDKINHTWEVHITEDLIKKAAQGFIKRCHKVVAANGSHQINE